MRVHENDRTISSLVWEVRADDDKVLAKLSSKELAEAVMALLDRDKPFLVIQLAGGLVQDVYCPAGLGMNRAAYIVDEDVEGLEIDQIISVTADDDTEYEAYVRTAQIDNWDADDIRLAAVESHKNPQDPDIWGEDYKTLLRREQEEDNKPC